MTEGTSPPDKTAPKRAWIGREKSLANMSCFVDSPSWFFNALEVRAKKEKKECSTRLAHPFRKGGDVRMHVDHAYDAGPRGCLWLAHTTRGSAGGED